jgi:hypothetical protein
MKFITTSRLVELLQEQDPSGDRAIQFRITDIRDADEEIEAFGEVTESELSISIKNLRQTRDGDKNILQIDLPLEFN